jgi:hypothetical protein
MEFKKWLYDSNKKLLEILATASTVAAINSAGNQIGIDINQLDQFGIGIEQINDLLNHAKFYAITPIQIQLLNSAKQKIELREKCFKEPEKGRDFHIRKNDQIEACDKYCKITKDKNACSKAGYISYHHRGRNIYKRDPFNR